jgi:hypothetical protein
VVRSSDTRPEHVPFALEAVTESAAPVRVRGDVLLVQLTEIEAESAAAASASVPRAADLPEGAFVAILPVARREKGLFARLMPAKKVKAHVACAALLARGYVDLERGSCPAGAGVLVVGAVPIRSSREGA